MLDPLLSISPLDGRYRERLKNLTHYFSEFALIKYRLFVEIEWFIFLCNEARLEGTQVLSEKEVRSLQEIEKDFDVVNAGRVKEIEKAVNHDVKALEYYIKERLKAYPKLFELSEFIHFGCTSEDITNLAYGLLLKDFGVKEFMPLLSGVILDLYQLAKKYKNVPMLSHTHGQPASPTTVGKEFINFVARLERELEILKRTERLGKINGAVGNFNAHAVAYPQVDWINLSKKFVQDLGLVPNLYTTQIEPHDNLTERLHTISRINTILIDLCRDFWSYISFGYFKQKMKAGEVGSSTMPHKVNPIDFENAEGNLGLANALCYHLASKLPISRMQRDLTDSTVLRNLGVLFGYSVLGCKTILTGFQKLEINKEAMEKDLNENWEVLAEAIQTVLRKYKIKGAYEKLKKLTRGKKLTDDEIKKFISQLKIGEKDKKRLMALTPKTYTGLASKLVESYRLKIV